MTQYSDRDLSSKLPSLVAVGLVHVGIGYAFISGLAYSVVKYLPPSLVVESIRGTPPPPPMPEPAPQPKALPRTAPVDRVVEVPLSTVPNVALDTPIIIPLPSTPTVEPAHPLPPATQARAPVAKAGRAGWITTEDYPSAAIRAEAQGAVGISVAIDARGRVTDCTVTRSSGNAQLDATTCRLYAARGRFTPALDEAGAPVAGTLTDRVTWRLPD